MEAGHRQMRILHGDPIIADHRGGFCAGRDGEKVYNGMQESDANMFEWRIFDVNISGA